MSENKVIGLKDPLMVRAEWRTKMARLHSRGKVERNVSRMKDWYSNGIGRSSFRSSGLLENVIWQPINELLSEPQQSLRSIGETWYIRT